MLKKLKSAFDFFKEDVWKLDVDALGFAKRTGTQFLRFLSATFSSFTGHPTGLHAAGLTYFMILGIVPVLCLLMISAKMCGLDQFARDKINEQIDAFIAQVEEGQAKALDDATAVPRNEDASIQEATDDKVKMAYLKADVTKDIAKQVRSFSNETFDGIEKVDFTALGWVGFAMLVWTVVSTLGQVESSFNEIWFVEKPRPIWLRIPLYIFIVVVLPILSALELSLPILRVVKTTLDATLGATSYTKWVGDAVVALITSRIFGFAISLFFSSLAFAMLLKLMPYHKVRFWGAMKAGVITALLSIGWIKLCTLAGVGIAKSSAMYGSFAALPILLAWIYVSWKIILLGSCISYAFECVHSRRLLRAGD